MTLPDNRLCSGALAEPIRPQEGLDWRAECKTCVRLTAPRYERNSWLAAPVAEPCEFRIAPEVAE